MAEAVEQPFPKPGACGIIMSLGFSIDGLLLAAGDNKGSAHVWARKAAGWSCLASLKGHEGDVVACKWAKQRVQGFQLMTAGHDKDVKFWAPKDGQLAQPWSALATYHTGHKEALSECLWVQHGELCALVTSSGDKTVRVHGRTGKNLSDWVCCAVLQGHEGSVCGCTAAVDSEGMLTIATVSLDQTARIWTSELTLAELLRQRVKAGQEMSGWSMAVLQDAKVTPHGGDQRISFCPTDEALLAVTTGKSVQLWERWEAEGAEPNAREAGAGAKWEQSAVLTAFDGYVNSLSFREDGMLLAAVDHTGIIKVWTRESEPGVVEGTWRGLIESGEPKGTFWSCVFGSHQSATLLVAGGFSGYPMPTDTAAAAPLHTARVRRPDGGLHLRCGVVAAAQLYKADGNNLFRDKKYEEAIACYKGALALLADDPAKAVAGEEGVEDEATELATTCHCNIAACALNCATLPDNFAVAEEHCDQVLATDPKHPKALYRRGMALMGQNRLEEAEKAMHTAREVMGADDPQIVTALRQVDLSKMWLFFGIGQDGSMVIEDECYEALRACVQEGTEEQFADFADLITALHTGQLGLTKDGEQPPELHEIISALEDAIGIDAIHQIAWERFEGLACLAPALEAFDGVTVVPQVGQSCCQYLVEFLGVPSQHADLKKDAGYMVPPGDKWPKNNGFLRILPLLGYHRVLIPQAGDVVVYTTGYVVEQDKLGYTRGQACHAGVVVEVEVAGGEGTGRVTVQSKPVRQNATAIRHPLKVVPPHLFNVAGGGPFCYFYRKNGKE